MAEAQLSTSFNPAELIKRVEDTEKRLQTKDAEIQVYKMLMAQMEEELAQAKKVKAIHEKQAQDVDSIKTESEKTLTKAKSLIFERTKIIKNQELQIEAFVQQIESLKEVVRITKDLLEIRNLEIKQLENKISAIEGKMKCEQERFDLMHKKLEQMIRHNGELKREYETQLCLFSALRERYNERELAKDIVDDLKEELADAQKQSDDSIINNVENKHDETEGEKEDEVQADTNKYDNNALLDAKNRLDSILNVLEDTSASSSDVNNQSEKEESKDLTTSENADFPAVENNLEAVAASTENIDTIENAEPKTETVVSENKAQVEANSTLDNIISALKNTIGLGSAASDPVVETKPEGEVNTPEKSASSSELMEKKE